MINKELFQIEDGYDLANISTGLQEVLVGALILIPFFKPRSIITTIAGLRANGNTTQPLTWLFPHHGRSSTSQYNSAQSTQSKVRVTAFFHLRNNSDAALLPGFGLQVLSICQFCLISSLLL
jgi:hypothetical protein